MKKSALQIASVDITPCMLGRAARELCTLCF